MLNIYIPSISKNIPSNILNSITMQTLKGNITIVDNVFPDEPVKHQRIAMVKNVAREAAIKSGCDFMICHDADIEDLFPDNFEKLQDFLNKNSDYGAVSLMRMRSLIPSSFHICDGVIMIRRQALEFLNFNFIPNCCDCISVKKSLNTQGFKYDYVDDLIRVKHLHRKLL